MNTKLFRSIFINFLALFIIFLPVQTVFATTPQWIGVPDSPFGKQLWDRNSIQKNQDGSIRVLSKFIPKNTTKITQNILYTMDIDCSENSFRDVAIGAKEFNEFTNKDPEWKDPNGDELIVSTINAVCAFGN